MIMEVEEGFAYEREVDFKDFKDVLVLKLRIIFMMPL